MTHRKLRLIKKLIQAPKIAIGSVMAILIASALHLDFAAQAGIITLLSVVSTKWGTLKLSLARILSFPVVVLVAFAVYPLTGNEWVSYGVFILVTVLFSSLLGIESTISANAVIGTHFLTTRDYSVAFICNEFLLVLIGVAVAVILNLINGNESQKKKLRQDIYYVDEKLRLILKGIADDLRRSEKETDIWQELSELEHHLTLSTELAHEYQGNTFASHPEYYIQYMKMRSRQCNLLSNLHHEINKIRTFPVQAEMIADYIRYLTNYVVERNVPDMQEQELKRNFKIMEQQPLPVTRAEFESRAILYHVLLGLEDFLQYKRRFVESLTEEQQKIYWDMR